MMNNYYEIENGPHEGEMHSSYNLNELILPYENDKGETKFARYVKKPTDTFKTRFVWFYEYSLKYKPLY